jgi:GNAT superfamily N-acetyltransferase
MSLPSATTLFDVLDATWPADETLTAGGFVLRRSDGGGKRVTAASHPAGALPDPAGVEAAEARMRAWDQPPLFMIRDPKDPLDRLLSDRGYSVVDPSILYAAPLAPLLEVEVPRLAAFQIWPPLAIMREIWAEGGIGPDRVQVMERAPQPLTGFLGRIEDRAAGAGFVSAKDGIAMLHALEIRSEFRRKGLARYIVGAMAQWAARQGCGHLGLAVTQRNAGARALYQRLGMKECGSYHYRIKCLA